MSPNKYKKVSFKKSNTSQKKFPTTHQQQFITPLKPFTTKEYKARYRNGKVSINKLVPYSQTEKSIYLFVH